MVRPTKQGLDYFPLDIHLDDKFKFVEIKFKLEGFAIIIKLMQRIYSQGYWCKWTEDELLLFSDEIRAGSELVEKVVSECLERGIFNKKLYDQYKILTSSGIQKRYKEIVRRRKGVEVIKEYLLIEGNFGVNDDINNSYSKHDVDKSTQSKVKESKVNKSNKTVFDEIKDLRREYPSELNSLIDEYWEVIKKTRKTNKISDSVILKTMKQWQKYKHDVIHYSLKKHIESCDDGERTEKYTLGIMRNTSPQQAEDELNKKNPLNQKRNQNKTDPRDKEIALQQWIAEGNNPEQFRWN